MKNMGVASAPREIPFEIPSNHTEIRLYLPASDRFGTKRKSVWFQTNRKMVNKNRPRSDPIKFQKDFPACIGNWSRSRANLDSMLHTNTRNFI